MRLLKISKKTDIEVFSQTRGTEFIVLDYYLHQEHDLAIIKVQHIDGVPGTLTTIPNENSSVGLYGFPNILEMDDDTAKLGQYLGCKISFKYPNLNIIEIRPIVPVSNVTDNIRKTLGGFSGSGIYLESNNNLYLIGVFTQLKEQNGAFNRR